MGEAKRRLRIALDGRVIAMAQSNLLARTGIFIVTVGFASALSQRDDVELYVLGCEQLSDVFLSGIKGLPRHSIRPLPNLTAPLLFFSTFHPIDPEISANPSIIPVQMVHDLAFHACPQLGDRGLHFERQLMASITPRTVVAAASQCTRNDLRRFFKIPAEQIVVTYEGVRNEWIPGPNMEAMPDFISRFKDEGAVYLLALSTIEPRKNLSTILRAFSSIYERAALNTKAIPRIYLVVVGAKGWGDDINLGSDLHRGAKENVLFTGFLPDEELPATIAHALCLIYPSWYEGFGLPVLEAMHLGTPVIVSNRGSLPEIVGPNAILVNPDDDEAISQAVVTLAASEEARQSARTAVKKQSAMFSWHNACDELLAHPWIKASTRTYATSA